MAVAERFSTSLPAWMSAHAFGCLIAMAHRCVSLGAFTARSERYGHHVVGSRATTERRPLGHGRIAWAAACSTADWHGVADLRREHGPRSWSETADQGAMTAERPEDEVPATKDARGVHQALAGDAAPHLPGRWVLERWSRCATPLPSQSFLRRKVRPQNLWNIGFIMHPLAILTVSVAVSKFRQVCQ